jgi:hypothetical protein
LQEGLSISSAISRARESLSSDTSTLVGALQPSSSTAPTRDGGRAGAALGRAQRRGGAAAVDHEIGERHGFDSAPWAFAARWATTGCSARSAWRRRRCARPRSWWATRRATTSTPTRSASRPLQLFAVRSGARVLVLPITGVAGLSEVLGAFAPQVVVIAGAHAADDDVARWAYRVRAASGALPMALFRRGGRAEATRTTASILPDSAGEAHRIVLDILDSRSRGVAVPAEDHIDQPAESRQVNAS